MNFKYKLLKKKNGEIFVSSSQQLLPVSDRNSSAIYWSGDYVGTPYDGDTSGYTIAIYILLFVAISFASLCLILNFVMLCADCCCRITKCMTVIPKIISGFATLAGVLADAACVVFLIKIYVGRRPSDVFGIEEIYPIPSYSFYLVALTGIFLMIAGCIICGVKHATKVEDSESDVRIVVSGSASQSQSQWATPANQQGMYMGAPPFYQSQQMAFANGNPPYNQVPLRIFLTHTSTQTT
nr:hypothetical protein BgiMline_020388 [Biomphalaria glabrata]